MTDIGCKFCSGSRHISSMHRIGRSNFDSRRGNHRLLEEKVKKEMVHDILLLLQLLNTLKGQTKLLATPVKYSGKAFWKF